MCLRSNSFKGIFDDCKQLCVKADDRRLDSAKLPFDLCLSDRTTGEGAVRGAKGPL